MPNKVEIRVSRVKPNYDNNGKILNYYISGVEGHYFSGETFNEAVAKAMAKFPNEHLNIEVFKLFVDDLLGVHDDGYRQVKINNLR